MLEATMGREILAFCMSLCTIVVGYGTEKLEETPLGEALVS